MRRLSYSPYEIAERYIGLHELAGDENHPFIQHCFGLCGMSFTTPDETPWCSAFAQHPCWELSLPRSKSARARSWLAIGLAINLELAEPGMDMVVLKRGSGKQPGPNVFDAPGHVGFFAGREGNSVLILGANQSDRVSIAAFDSSLILRVMRLA